MISKSARSTKPGVDSEHANCSPQTKKRKPCGVLLTTSPPPNHCSLSSFQDPFRVAIWVPLIWLGYEVGMSPESSSISEEGLNGLRCHQHRVTRSRWQCECRIFSTQNLGYIPSSGCSSNPRWEMFIPKAWLWHTHFSILYAWDSLSTWLQHWSNLIPTQGHLREMEAGWKNFKGMGSWTSYWNSLPLKLNHKLLYISQWFNELKHLK